MRAYFPKLTVLDGGPCRFGLESTIVSPRAERPRVLRPGSLPLPTLRQALDGMTTEMSEADSAVPRVPATLPAHHVPSTPLEIVPVGSIRHRATTISAEGIRVAVLRHNRGPRQTPHPLVQFLEDWWAVNDRLVRGS